MNLLRSVTAHLETLFPDEHQRRTPRPTEPGTRFEVRSAGQSGVEVRLLGIGDDRPGQEVLAGLAVRLLALHLLERFEVDPESCGRAWLLVTGHAEQIHLRTLVPAGVQRFFPVPVPVTRSTEGGRVVLSALGEQGSGPSEWAALAALRRKLALDVGTGETTEVERRTTGFLAF